MTDTDDVYLQERRRRREENLKLYFECFKHQTTLDVATAVGFVALFQALGIRPIFVAGALVFLAVSVVFSLIGMAGVMTEMEKDMPDLGRKRGWWWWTTLPVLHELSYGSFFSGLSVFAVSALVSQ
jgi:hypothetical protein